MVISMACNLEMMSGSPVALFPVDFWFLGCGRHRRLIYWYSERGLILAAGIFGREGA